MIRVPNNEHIYQQEEYTIVLMAYVCTSCRTSSSQHHYFIDYENRERYDSVTHAVCLVTKAERGGRYDQGDKITNRVKMLRLNSLLDDDGNLVKRKMFEFCGKEVLVKFDRYDYIFNKPMFNEHPSTNNGAKKEIDYYCGRKSSDRFTIELAQNDIERSTIVHTKIPSPFSYDDGFYHLNNLTVEPFIKQNLFMMFAVTVHKVAIIPTFLKDHNSQYLRDEVNIPPMPLSLTSIMIHSTLLYNTSKLDQEDDIYLIIHFVDVQTKKYSYLIRRITIESKENVKYGKLSKCDFSNFFKYFNDKVTILGHCRLNDSCFLYRVCSKTYVNEPWTFNSIPEFEQNTQWILIDLEKKIVKEIQPYTLKLIPSTQKLEDHSEDTLVEHSEDILVDEDGFIQKQKRKKYFNLRKMMIKDNTSTIGSDFSQISLSSCKPFPYTNPALVNVICTVLALERRKSTQKKQLSDNSVIYLKYQFKLDEVVTEVLSTNKLIGSSFADARFFFSK